MGDFMEGIFGDGDDDRKGLLLPNLLNKQGGDSEGREERSLDADKPEVRGGDLQTQDGARVSDMGQGDQSMIPGLRRARGSSFSFEDPGLIPGDLEHEFILLKKKKFPGINIVQVRETGGIGNRLY